MFTTNIEFNGLSSAIYSNSSKLEISKTITQALTWLIVAGPVTCNEITAILT